jgi:hypothetical protein
LPSATSHKRYKQLIERKRQARRRQLIYRAAAALLVLVVAGLLTLAIAGVRSCAAHRNGGHSIAKGHTPQPKPVDPAQSKINLVFVHDFHPGPQFVALDSQRVYIGVNTPGKDKVPPSTQLAAFNFDSKDALWQSPAETSLMQLGISGGNIVGVPEGETGLQRYDGLSGKPLAAIEVEPGAELRFDGREVITGYTTVRDNGSPGIRLTAYDPKSGQRLWTTRPKLSGLSASGLQACCGSSPNAELNCWAGVCAYRMHNVVGFLNTKGGRLLRPEYNASGHILAVQIDRLARTGNAHTGMAYIVSADKSDDTLFRLIRIPLDDTYKPKRLLEFRSNSSDFLLLGDAGRVLLAFADAAGKAKLACFRKDATEAALTLDVDAGVTDMSAVPGSGDFLVATCSKFKDGEPVGRAKLLRIRLGKTAEALQAATYGQPVQWVVPFKRDCLVLERGGGIFGGGQVIRYNSDSGRLKLLRRAKYDLLEPQNSADQTTLMVSSYPQSYLQGKGGALQVLVFK